MSKVLVQKVSWRGADGQFICDDDAIAEVPESPDEHEQAAKMHADKASTCEGMGDMKGAAMHREAEYAHRVAAQHQRSGSIGGEVWRQKARKASTGLRREEKKKFLQAVPGPNGGTGDFGTGP